MTNVLWEWEDLANIPEEKEHKHFDSKGRVKKNHQKVGFWPTRPDPPPLPPSWHSNFEKMLTNFFKILMDSIHFKTDFSMKTNILFVFTSFSRLLFTVSKLYNTYYLLRLLMMVCTVLIWFIFTVLQESSNLDAIFIVCRKIKIKFSKLVFLPTPPPFLVKSQLKKKTFPNLLVLPSHAASRNAFECCLL